jgi:hypothetical protein
LLLPERESAIERYLVRQAEALGGLCWKFVSPGNAGVPDRLIILPAGRVAFVETKRPGGKVRALQRHRIAQLTDRGVWAGVADTRERIDQILKQIGGDAQ